MTMHDTHSSAQVLLCNLGSHVCTRWWAYTEPLVSRIICMLSLLMHNKHLYIAFLDRDFKLFSDEKKFKCTECDRSFRQKAHLTTHKLTHTGEKNITCQYCNQKFARQSDFKQHEYRHTRALIYKCEQCGKEFFKQQNYKKHLLIHDGCRDFGCSLCSKSFASNYHLKRHKQKCKGVKKGQTLILNSDDVTLEDVAMASDTLARPSARESMASDTLARPSVRDSNKRKLYNCLFE